MSAAATRILDVYQERIAVGTATGLDIAQQESLVAQQRAAIPPLDQQLRQNIATLAVLLGEPPARLTVRGGSLSAIAPQRVSPGLPSDLLLQRPDIREAEAQLCGRQRQCGKRARRAVAEHLAHRAGRLRQHRAATRCSFRSRRSIRSPRA